MDDIVSRIIGQRTPKGEDDLIPTGAKEIGVDDDDKEDSSGESKPAQPVEGAKEPLLEPVLALVAPDATPKAAEPLHPSQIPEPTEKPVPEPSAAQPSVQDKSAQALRAMMGGGSKPASAMTVMTGQAESKVPVASTLPAGITGAPSFAIPTPTATPTATATPAPTLLESNSKTFSPAPPVNVDIAKTMDVYRQFVRF